jgi:septum formation protein
MVQFLAQAKAKAVASSLQSGLVIGSDSTIAFRHVILGKPRDNSDAEQTLSMLRGEWHDVLSGVAVVDADTGRCVVSSVSTKIKMRAYSDEELRAYVETGEPLDKAGSYAIQGLGGRLVETLDGCFNNVVGLPLCELAKLLSGFGISPPIQSPVCLLPDGRPCPRLRIP